MELMITLGLNVTSSPGEWFSAHGLHLRHLGQGDIASTFNYSILRLTVRVTSKFHFELNYFSSFFDKFAYVIVPTEKCRQYKSPRVSINCFTLLSVSFPRTAPGKDQIFRKKGVSI